MQRSSSVDRFTFREKAFFEQVSQVLGVVVEDDVMDNRVVVVFDRADILSVSFAAPIHTITVCMIRRTRRRVEELCWLNIFLLLKRRHHLFRSCHLRSFVDWWPLWLLCFIFNHALLLIGEPRADIRVATSFALQYFIGPSLRLETSLVYHTICVATVSTT